MFDIQISNPSTNNKIDPNDHNIDEAIESIFPLENEYCFIIWNHIFVPISYKYDVSVMAKDIISMIEFIKNNEAQMTINWPSNTFAATWHIDSTGDYVKIQSSWSSVLGNLKELLNQNSYLEVGKKEFITKWLLLLSYVKTKLEEAGYNSKNLTDFIDLENTIK